MEAILDLAKNISEEAEVFRVSSEETTVNFQANHLKGVQSKQTEGVSLRITKNGRLGYAAASGQIDSQKLVDIASDTAQFGMLARFDFSSAKSFPQVNVFDSEVGPFPISEMIELGQVLVDTIIKSSQGILCDAGISKETLSISLINSRGGHASYKKTNFGLGVGGTLIRGTDMLFVGESQESCRPTRDTKSIIDVVLNQLALAKDLAMAPNRQLPVIFTPDGVASAFIPALMAAFNGKVVLQGASPVGKRLGERVLDTHFSLFDDSTVDYAPRSRPCDDEGVTSQRTPLVENGIIMNFLYDLQTAGQAEAKSTGSGSRGRGGLISPSPSAFIIDAGKTTFSEMVQDIKQGLVVEQLMGAEQGNILGGDFSGNVLLGYKIENGRIVGRVKNTMVSGNVYQVLNDIAIGKETKWVGGAVLSPHIFCPSLAVASK